MTLPCCARAMRVTVVGLVAVAMLMGVVVHTAVAMHEPIGMAIVLVGVLVVGAVHRSRCRD